MVSNNNNFDLDNLDEFNNVFAKVKKVEQKENLTPEIDTEEVQESQSAQSAEQSVVSNNNELAKADKATEEDEYEEFGNAVESIADDGIIARGVEGNIDIRLSFIERLNLMDKDVIEWHSKIQQHLLSYRKVKSRYSARCDSYRFGRDLIAKMAIGGKTLKLYLSVDPEDAALEDGKYHQRDLSMTCAYQEVPLMLPIRSDLAVRKACKVIDYMMSNFNIGKKRPRKLKIQDLQDK